MPDTTDLHGYQLFSDGEENWEHRTDFQQLDIDVELRGDTDPDTAGKTPKDGAKYLDTSTGEIYLGDGNEWSVAWDLGAIGSGGDGSVGDSISVQNNTGEVYAREFSGADLGTKIENAVAYLSNNTSGRGRIRVTPPADGSVWNWDTEVSIEPPSSDGLHIDIDSNVRIDYTGNGQQLEYWGHVYEGTNTTHGFAPLILTGGQWEFSGDPDGWLRTHDLSFSVIHPQDVRGCSNADGTAICVEVRHYEHWSEVSRVSGAYEGDIGIEFKHGAYLDSVPGTHNSFHGWTITDCYVNAFNQGIVLRGNWSFCNGRNIHLWAADSDVDLLTLGAFRIDGTVFNTVKFEDPGGDDSGTTAIVLAEEYDGYYGPLIVAPKIGSAINTTVRDDASVPNPSVVTIDAYGSQFRVHDLYTGGTVTLDSGTVETGSVELESTSITNYADGYHTSIEHTGGGDLYFSRQGEDLLICDQDRVETTKPFGLLTGDVRNMSSSQGYMAYHDPSVSGDTNTEGPAFYNGTDWTSLVDGSTIT